MKNICSFFLHDSQKRVGTQKSINEKSMQTIANFGCFLIISPKILDAFFKFDDSGSLKPPLQHAIKKTQNLNGQNSS